jgi:hypothetical protein
VPARVERTSVLFYGGTLSNGGVSFLSVARRGAYRAASVALFAALCACGGGGGGSNSSVPGGPGPATPVPTSGPATASVTFTVLIPRSTSSAVRRPKYVSSLTQSIRVTVNGGTPVTANVSQSSPACTSTAQGLQCTVTAAAPAGTVTIFVELFGEPGGGGPPLSQGTTTATVVPGAANNVVLTLNGVVAKIVLSLANPTPQQGTPATIPLTVTMQDASGATIIGDPFLNPVTLTDSDTSGATSLNRTRITSPADAVGLTLSYNGTAVGSVTIGATASGVDAGSVTTATLRPSSGPPPPSFVDWPTYGFDNHRDGYNPSSTSLSPSSLAQLHPAWQQLFYNSDYNTQTQPVLATNLANHAGLLYVGGSLGVLYAFDALTGTQVWQRSLGAESYLCDNGSESQMGIGGTVAYDAASRTVYVASNVNGAPNSPATSSIVRLDAATGAPLGSVQIASSALTGELNVSHTSVALANGFAYAGTSAPCDVSSWRGRVAAVNANASGSARTFFTTYGVGGNYSGGGVWGWGGVSVDDAGAVYAGVGNSDSKSGAIGPQPPFVQISTEQAGYGEHVIKVSADLSSLLGANDPNGRVGNESDVDFAATPVLFKPVGCSDTLMAAEGKAGELLVYDTANVGAGPIGRFRISPTSSEAADIANPAWSPSTGLLYVNVTSATGGSIDPPGIIALRPSGCNASTTIAVAWHTAFGPDSFTGTSVQPRSSPTVTAGGVVLAGTPCSFDGSGGCLPTIGATFGGALWALDASTGALLNGGKPVLLTGDHIRVPAVVDGLWVYVQDNGADLYALTLDPNVKSIRALHPLHARHPSWYLSRRH